jgi:hypothetical protein
MLNAQENNQSVKVMSKIEPELSNNLNVKIEK